jgi:MoaA/NifB/PqqE/SkfB family radical SAM enzyme
LTRIATTFTTRCNLRCVYCPEGSHPESFYGDMTLEMVDDMIAYARLKSCYVDISYYGDSTFHPRFAEYANRILDGGVELAITSNLARLLNDDEIAVLARCRKVAFSMDTSDRDAAKALRNGLDLRTLAFNVLRVRAYCLSHDIPVPPFNLHAVLVDTTVRTIGDVVAFAASLGVRYVGCNELSTIEGARGNVRNVAELEGDDLIAAIHAINAAVALAKRLDVQFILSQAQVELINAAAKGTLRRGPREKRTGIQGEYTILGDEAVAVQPGMTRGCVEPWVGPFLNPNGDVYSCCARGTTMGRVDETTSFADVFNNENFRQLRLSLLSGEQLDPECRLCHLAGESTVEALQSAVVRLSL